MKVNMSLAKKKIQEMKDKEMDIYNQYRNMASGPEREGLWLEEKKIMHERHNLMYALGLK